MDDRIYTALTYHLENDRALSVEGVAGDRLRVVRGRVWLSEESLASDRILDAGDEMALVAGEVAVMQALGPAVVKVLRAESSARHAGTAALLDAMHRLRRAAASLRARLHLGPDTALTIAP
jgi:hypothetical protein